LQDVDEYDNDYDRYQDVDQLVHSVPLISLPLLNTCERKQLLLQELLGRSLGLVGPGPGAFRLLAVSFAATRALLRAPFGFLHGLLSLFLQLAHTA
jgi:hypothetical protein